MAYILGGTIIMGSLKLAGVVTWTFCNIMIPLNLYIIAIFLLTTVETLWSKLNG